MEGSQNWLPGKQKRRLRNRPKTPKETDMNAFVSSLYRDLTCAAAALLISMIIGASFVQSTATAPGNPSAPAAATALHA
jgi:hypothetical protein